MWIRDFIKKDFVTLIINEIVKNRRLKIFIILSKTIRKSMKYIKIKNYKSFSKLGIEKYESASYQYLFLNWNPLNILATFAKIYCSKL